MVARRTRPYRVSARGLHPFGPVRAWEHQGSKACPSCPDRSSPFRIPAVGATTLIVDEGRRLVEWHVGRGRRGQFSGLVRHSNQLQGQDSDRHEREAETGEKGSQRSLNRFRGCVPGVLRACRGLFQPMQ